VAPTCYLKDACEYLGIKKLNTTGHQKRAQFHQPEDEQFELSSDLGLGIPWAI